MGNKAQDFIIAHSKSFLAGVLGLVCVGAAVWGVGAYRESRERQAVELFFVLSQKHAEVFEAESADPMERLIKEAQKLKSPSEASDEASKGSEENSANKSAALVRARADVLAFIKQWGFARVGARAVLQLASRYQAMGQEEEALALFEEAQEHVGARASWGLLYKVYEFQWAGALMGAEKLGPAAQKYEGLLKSSRSRAGKFLLPYVLYRLAFCYELLGRLDEAKRHYSELVDQHGDSYGAREARMRLRWLSANAGGVSGSDEGALEGVGG